jgi:DMSO/TMAO reductase YedYZ molybdopterin-dependent catalytic subunit
VTAPPPTAASRAPVPAAVLAGAVAALAALAIGELPTALAGDRVGLVTAVSNEFIDRFAAVLKDVAVALFGENDKVALVVGVVVTSVVLGAVFGVVARSRLWIGVAGFVVFGCVGLAALLTDPGSNTALAVWSAGLAVGTGVATLVVLLRLAGRTATESVAEPTTRAWGPGDDPTVKTPARRQFLAVAGVLGVTATATGLAGRALRTRTSVEAERAALVLPDPVGGASPLVPLGPELSVDGLSPYLTPIEDFYRIDTAIGTPQVEAGSWRLRISGLVDDPYEVTLEELLAMGLVEETVTIACVSNEVGGRLVGNARWLGVRLDSLLERAGVQAEATQVVGRSTDGFTVGFPTATALDGRVSMVAVGMNGEPLPAANGYPARLIVAGLYGYVSATKWLSEIELTRLEDFDAYWIPRGWSKDGPIKIQSRIDVPRSGSAVEPGETAIAGVAWAPTVGISAVEVQVDDGAWESAELGDVVSDDTWRQWVYRWDARPGEHTIRVRAVDGRGSAQTAEEQEPRPDGATGHHTIEVQVRAA